MVDRNKELGRNTIILGIGQLFPKLFSLLLLPFLTAYLTTEEYDSEYCKPFDSCCDTANSTSRFSILVVYDTES